MSRLAGANRVHVAKNSIQYRRYATDHPYTEHGNIWTDTGTGSFTERKRFVVQTNTKVIERCIHLATDPGDLVLDPTCGSGTTAWCAEKWGRRWITIDTSRVGVAIARQRLLTAAFELFETLPGWRQEFESRGGASIQACSTHQTVREYRDERASRSNSGTPRQGRLDDHLSEVNRELAAISTRTKKGLETPSVQPGPIRCCSRRKATVELDQAGWYHWEVPFNVSPKEWPAGLRVALNWVCRCVASQNARRSTPA